MTAPPRIVRVVPKLWTESIESHRREVREAVVRATAHLMTTEGPLAVTMSRIAEAAGIGRATLYKYFPDVEAILVAWHDEQVHQHLAQLADARGTTADPTEQLTTMLTVYAEILHASREHPHSDLAAFLHKGERVEQAERELRQMMRDLIKASAGAGTVRSDITADELTTYCMSALGAAAHTSKAGVRRIVRLTLDALRPPS